MDSGHTTGGPRPPPPWQSCPRVSWCRHLAATTVSNTHKGTGLHRGVHLAQGLAPDVRGNSKTHLHSGQGSTEDLVLPEASVGSPSEADTTASPGMGLPHCRQALHLVSPVSFQPQVMEMVVSWSVSASQISMRDMELGAPSFAPHLGPGPSRATSCHLCPRLVQSSCQACEKAVGA